jgi:hypothetical protein
MPSSSQLFLVLSGIALGIAVTVALYAGHAEAQRAAGPYFISQHSNPNALAGVFRVNQSTGYVSYCYIDAGGRPQVTCTPETP